MRALNFESVTVSGFRGFQKVELEDLNRFNLIVGRNNVGKTALLEAVFLMLGPTNPQLALVINGFRGIEQARNDPEDLWGWLFYKKKMKQPITIRAKTPKGSRQLSIVLTEPSARTIQGDMKPSRKGKAIAQATTDIGPSELLLTYEDEKREKTQSRAYIKETGLAISPGRKLTFPTSIFVTARGGNAPDNAERYSKLEEAGQESQILEPLKIIEPRLKRLAIIVTGAGPLLHGDIGLGRLVPLPFMGEGMGRLMTILLAIISSKGGAVMIDEIEIGVHYSAMASAWSAIAKAARDCETQIFATTHSFECVRAAYESFSASENYDLAVQRLDRIDGDVKATFYDKEMIDMALASGIEFR